jgi:hypothetical protein
MLTLRKFLHQPLASIGNVLPLLSEFVRIGHTGVWRFLVSHIENPFRGPVEPWRTQSWKAILKGARVSARIRNQILGRLNESNFVAVQHFDNDNAKSLTPQAK